MENNIVQGSIEWKECRLGKATASKMADLTAKTKSGYSASRDNYMAQLVVERLTGQIQDGYTNAAMQWGTETEPQARAAYELETDNQVVEVAFIDHPNIKMTGASPDGLVLEDGLIEIKCPNTATHIDFLLSGKIDDKYIKQMHWQMACTGRKWCDFVSFDPRLPVNLQLKILRVERDEMLIDLLENEVTKFLTELDNKLLQLQKLE